MGQSDQKSAMWRHKNEWLSIYFYWGFCSHFSSHLPYFMTSHGQFLSHFVPLHAHLLHSTKRSMTDKQSDRAAPILILSIYFKGRRLKFMFSFKIDYMEGLTEINIKTPKLIAISYIINTKRFEKKMVWCLLHLHPPLQGSTPSPDTPTC